MRILAIGPGHRYGATFGDGPMTRPKPKRDRQAVYHVQVFGELTRHVGRGVDVDELRRQLEPIITDRLTRGLLLEWDSPGGDLRGIDELSATILEGRSRGVHVTSIATGLMLSGAYWAASAAGRLVADPDALVGGIGVAMVHADFSQADRKRGIKYNIIRKPATKAKPNMLEPMDGETRKHLQSVVDEAADRLQTGIAANRGVAVADVVNGYGEGRAVTARQALRDGMIDGLSTVEKELRLLTLEETPLERLNDRHERLDEMTARMDRWRCN